MNAATNSGSSSSFGSSGSDATLLKKWFKAGKVSAPEAQEAATAFKQAGSASTEVGKLATAGKDGAIRGNVSRDVMNTLGKSSDLPETYTTKLFFGTVRTTSKSTMI